MSELDAESCASVFIAGTGRLGLSLGRAIFERAPPALVGLAWHSEAGRDRAARWLPEVPRGPIDDPSGLDSAEVIILAVRDDAIEEVAAQLVGLRRADQVVLHTSGLETSAVLRGAGLRAPVGSFHPLQTFADPASGPARLRRCMAACEGDPEAVRAGFRLARVLGAQPLELAPAAKAAYHAAAVVASNYLVVITALAARLAAVGGIDEAQAIAMLAPLQRGALDNLSELGLAAALTGPIARGDTATVRAHLAAIRDHAPDLADAYAVLGRHAVELARQSGVDETRLCEIESLLER